MINKLTLVKVGPSDEMEIPLAPRLNIMTGDNGLGKSFILDAIWWIQTRTWPMDLNRHISSGGRARPLPSQQNAARIIAEAVTSSGTKTIMTGKFNKNTETWKIPGRPCKWGLILYSMYDGGFALWDPERNYALTEKDLGTTRKPAYVFSTEEVWQGKIIQGATVCNGLIADWAGWHKENGAEIALLRDILKILSPEGEELKPGKLTRISVDDVRDIPTVIMPYNGDAGTPVLHLSSGIRRILSLAYMLIWAWREHQKACEVHNVSPSAEITFLVDEVETHLHPRWQRSILKALVSVLEKLTGAPKIQLVVSTHAPLVMSSCEDFFDNGTDAWLDLDCRDNRVILTDRKFEPLGEVSAWLTSEAFDLSSDRSMKNEALLKEASRMLRDDLQESPDLDSLKAMRRRLAEALSEDDPFRLVWNIRVNTKYPQINE